MRKLVTFLQGMAEAYQADYLVSADQAIPDWLVYDSIFGKIKTIIKSPFFLMCA